MHWLTTYCPDIMTNFGCMRIRSTVTYLPIFQVSFPKYTRVKYFSLNACQACNFPTETTNHKFYECPAVKSFWNDAFDWLNLKRSENITPSAMEILYTVCRERSVRQPGASGCCCWASEFCS